MCLHLLKREDLRGLTQLIYRNNVCIGSGQIFGDKACHPERSEGSGSPDEETLRCAQDDSHDTSQVRSREVLSPNVYRRHKIFDILHGTCYKIEYETETRLPVSNISD